MITTNTYQIIELYATEKHFGQLRADGVTPFITHPIQVAKIIQLYGGDINQICAGLLHDVIEDTDTTLMDLKNDLQSFNLMDLCVDLVLTYCKEMTNVFTKDNFPTINRKERKKLEIEHFKSWSDVNLKLIKLADVFSNLSSFDSLKKDFAKIYILEELEIISSIEIDNTLFTDTKNLAETVYNKLF